MAAETILISLLFPVCTLAIGFFCRAVWSCVRSLTVEIKTMREELTEFRIKTSERLAAVEARVRNG